MDRQQATKEERHKEASKREAQYQGRQDSLAYKESFADSVADSSRGTTADDAEQQQQPLYQGIVLVDVQAAFCVPSHIPAIKQQVQAERGGPAAAAPAVASRWACSL